MKVEGKIKHIGISTQDIEVAIRATLSGKIDVIMIQINIANNNMPRRNEMLAVCEKEGVAVIAMKVFAGGSLLEYNKTVSVGGYKTAGVKLYKKKISKDMTTTKSIHYVLSRVGISAVVLGVANIEELDDCMKCLTATNEEKSYSLILKNFNEYITGKCVYCNHYQPCPVDIDI